MDSWAVSKAVGVQDCRFHGQGVFRFALRGSSFLSRFWDCFRRLLKNSGTNACSSASMDHRSVHAPFSERGSGSGQEFRVSRKACIGGWTRVCAHIDVRADLFATNMQSSVLKPDAFVFLFSSKTRSARAGSLGRGWGCRWGGSSRGRRRARGA